MTSILSAGVAFSIGMAFLLALALATTYRRQLDLSWLSQAAGYVMLAGLAVTQWGNAELAQAIQSGPGRRYVAVLFVQSLGFYLLLLGLLRPDPRARRADLGMIAVVLLLAAGVPPDIGVPLSMAMGMGFAVHLALLLYRLRALRRWFRVELPVVATFAGMGGIVAAAGLLAPNGLSWASFATLYGALITLGFLLVGWLLLAVPDLAMKTREAVATAYAQSTLSRVDLEAAAARLRRLFEVDRIYQQDDVSLSRVAELAGLSGHQLSELVNVHFQTSFSRFVRQYRVEAAKRMLVDEPRASVLSVGVAVGFSSQSTFYVAFKEVVGVVPGEYRRRQRGEDRGADPPAIPG